MAFLKARAESLPVFSGRAGFAGSDAIAFPSVVTVPVCAQLGQSNLDLLKSFMSAQPGLLKHQFTPLQNIQRWTGRGDGRLFDSIFVYQNIMDQLKYGGISWDVLDETSTADVCPYCVKKRKLTDLRYSIQCPLNSSRRVRRLE